mmetsp:Transcript_21478/g.39300  ORF Transcript_21478/g.39300 Transcript_21478/m.39300 type:complete len:497 (-) Transcript_21478:1221-2711(-)
MKSEDSSRRPSPFLKSNIISRSQSSNTNRLVAKIASKTVKAATHKTRESVEEVQNLDQWNTGEDPQCRNELDEIERTFKLRQGLQDQVQNKLLDRKAKLKLPTVIPKPVTDMQGSITERRLEVRKIATTHREKSRSAKAYEDELENIRAKHKLDLQAASKQREVLRIKVFEIRKHLIDLALDLEHDKRVAQRREEAEKKAKESKELSIAEFFYRRSTLRQNVEEKTTRYNQLKESLTEMIATTQVDCDVLDKKVHQMKENLRLIKRTQVNHYLLLLKEGKDTRSHGIEWVVRALWGLSFNVKEKQFPSFLDAECIDRVFDLANLNLELEDIQKDLDYELSSSRRVSKSADRWNGVKDRLSRIKTSVKTKRRRINVDRRTRQFNITWEEHPLEESPTKTPREDLSDLTWSLETQKSALQKRISDIKEKEVERLTHACFMTNYEKKFSIDMKTLLACVIGVENIDRVLTAINKEHKALHEQIQQAKTYRFSKTPELHN